MWLKVILLKLSLHWKSENWDLFRLRGKIKGRRIPQQWIMINGTGRTATAPPSGFPAHAEKASRGPLCQRDECWKLLGKRIMAVYVGQVARCQLLKCANFLKLQSFGSAPNPSSLSLPSVQDGRLELCSRGNSLCCIPPPPPWAHSPSLKCARIFTWCKVVCI